MQRRFTSFAGGFAVLALAVAGGVAAHAAGAETIEKVGYFEVQGAGNAAPEAWFSASGDDAAALRITSSGAELGASAEAVGINKIVDADFDPAAHFAIEATGSARFSIVLTSDEVDYLRLTADSGTLSASTTWSSSGMVAGGEPFPASPLPVSKTLSQWVTGDLWGWTGALDGAQLHQVGARHPAGAGAGTVASLTFGSTRFVFTPTPLDEADAQALVDAAVAEALENVDTDAIVEAALAEAAAEYEDQIGELESELAEAEGAIEELEAVIEELEAELEEVEPTIEELEAQVEALEEDLDDANEARKDAKRAAAKASDAALKAQAAAPFAIKGALKVGKTLRATGASVKGISVKYRWLVGGKKAGSKKTLKLTAKHLGKGVKLVVTKTYKDSTGKKRTVKVETVASAAAKVAA